MSRQKATALYWMLYMGTYSTRSHWISDSPKSGMRWSMRAPATARAWGLHPDRGRAAAGELAGGGVGEWSRGAAGGSALPLNLWTPHDLAAAPVLAGESVPGAHL